MIPCSPRRRQHLLNLAKVGTMVLFCLLVAQFFRLQVLEHQRWKRRAEAQHFFTVKEPFRRGTFYANTSVQPLHQDRPVAFAIDVPLSHLYADPKEIPPLARKEICETILRILGPPVKEASKLSLELRRKCRSRRLVSWIAETQKGLFLEWWRPLPNSTASRPMRFSLFRILKDSTPWVVSSARFFTPSRIDATRSLAEPRRQAALSLP